MDLIPELQEIKAPTEKQETTPGPKKERDPANFWLNVGVIRKNAEGEEKLITLPMGIPLDKLKSKDVPKKHSDFQQLRAAEKALWEQFKPFFESLKPGESKRVNFICEVRRVSDAETVEEETNPYALGKLNFG